MKDSIISNVDENVMKLLHYFIAIKGYNPIVLHGAENEIWLENMDSDYKIVRLVSNYIHNDEQFRFDVYRTRQIVKKIKKQTISFKINTLSIYMNLGDNVKNVDSNFNNILALSIKKTDDLKKYNDVMKAFPDITNETNFKEQGMDLFIKLTDDINRKNEVDNSVAADIFKSRLPYITYGLIVINFVIFLLMYIFGKGSRDVNTLVRFGALYRPYILSGDYFRLVTYCFLHIGVIHLFVNNYSLYVLGRQLEGFLGKAKYLFVYFISAISGGLMSMIFNNSVSAGASGAIFGLLGSLLYFGYNYRAFLGNVLRSQIIPLIVLNLMISFMFSGIDAACHIGGFVGGLFATLAVGLKHKTSVFEKVNGFIILILYFVFLCFVVFR